MRQPAYNQASGKEIENRMANYLENLTARLLVGTFQVPDQRRQPQSQFLLAQQNEDGGFSGREGPSDIYYTSFGLRGLAILGALDVRVSSSAVEFLRSRLSQQESIVDFYCLIYAARLLDAVADLRVFPEGDSSWRDAVANLLQGLRREDGGFAKGAEGTVSSTYHSFLALLCYELIDRAVDEPQKLVDFFLSQQMPEGGFREIRVSRRPGTNPTAAAIAALKILDCVDDETRASTVDFLVDMQGDEGGFCANTRIPFSDLLSTFTTLLTLADLEALDQVDLAAARRFTDSLTTDAGGFLGAAWDEVCDVEYTFYGLGTMALLSEDSTRVTSSGA